MRLPLKFYLTLGLAFSSPSWGQFRSNIIPLTSSEVLQSERPQKEKDSKARRDMRIWGSINTYNFKDGFILVKLKGTQYAGTLGIDYKATPYLRVGSYYVHSYVNSRSPIGTATYRSNIDSIYPYIIYDFPNFKPKVFLNLVGGYSYTSTHAKRHIPQNSTLIFSQSEATLLSTYPSLNIEMEECNIEASFQLGYGYEWFSTKRYVESNNNVVLGKTRTRNYTYVFSDIAYQFENGDSVIHTLAPYIQGGIDYNLQLTPLLASDGTKFNRAREGYIAGAGLRFYFLNDATLTAGWQYIGGHSGLSTNVYTILLRVGVF